MNKAISKKKDTEKSSKESPAEVVIIENKDTKEQASLTRKERGLFIKNFLKELNADRALRYAFGSMLVTLMLGLVTLTALIVAFYDGKSNFEKITLINREALIQYVDNVNLLTEKMNSLSEITKSLSNIDSKVEDSNELIRISQDNVRVTQAEITEQIKQITAVVDHETRRISELSDKLADILANSEQYREQDSSLITDIVRDIAILSEHDKEILSYLNNLTQAIQGISKSNIKVPQGIISEQKDANVLINKLIKSHDDLLHTLEVRNQMVRFP